MVLNISGGGDSPTAISTVAGGSVTVNNPVFHNLSGIVQNTEITYVRDSDGAVLYHVENVGVGGTTQYAYTYGGDVAATIHVHHLSYKFQAVPVTLGSTDQTLPIQQVADPVYSNP